jgi:hypothetical protein
MAYTTVNLRADAIAEARRLARARAVIRGGDREALDRLDGDATWVARTRGRRLRHRLGRRVCLIWRATFEDVSGQSLESHLVPMLVDLAHVSGSSWIRDVDRALRSRVEAESHRWRIDAARVNQAFHSARLARAQAIAAAAVSAMVPSQPGLFDRRGERQQQMRAIAAAVDEHALAERRDRMAAAELVAIPARLLLVLVP